MRYLLTIALVLLALPGWAAYTERYVTSAASGGGAGTAGDPWTLAEAFASAVAGDRVNVQSDSGYSLGTTTQTNAGASASMITFRGYKSTIGDLEGQGRNADGTLNTTDFPAITLTGVITPNSRTVFQDLNISGSVNGGLISTTAFDYGVVLECSFTNTANNSTAQAFKMDNYSVLINSDFACTGATHASVAQGDSEWIIDGCRFTTTDDAASFRAENVVAVECVFIGNGSGTGIYIENYNAISYSRNNTYYNLDEHVSLPSTTGTRLPVFVNDHATDGSKWLDNRYSATADTAVIEVNNRTRDNTTPRTGIGDGVNVGEITTDTGGAATDYVNAAAGNLRLISGAPGETAGMIAYSDVGAYQREPSTGGTTIIIVED